MKERKQDGYATIREAGVLMHQVLKAINLNISLPRIYYS